MSRVKEETDRAAAGDGRKGKKRDYRRLGQKGYREP